MRAQTVKVIIQDALEFVVDDGSAYILLPGSLPFGLCLDDLGDDEAAQILIDAGRSASVQKAIIAEIKNLLAAAGHEVDWEG